MKTVRDFPNIYLETCGSGLHIGGIEYPVRERRADRILFGTNMPLLDAQQLAKVLVSEISDEEKKLVLGGNAIRLPGLEL